MKDSLKGQLARAAVWALSLLVLSGTGHAFPTGSQQATEVWRDPCPLNGNLPPSIISLEDVHKQMTSNALETHNSASVFQTFLTTGTPPRIDSDEIRMLDMFNATVKNFPSDFTSNPKPNVSEVLLTDYVFLSKVYIFFNETLVNRSRCDTRSDAATGVEKLQSILTKTLLTLCDVDVYLKISGHPMPQELIPGRREVLDNAVPKLDELPCDNDYRNKRNQVDFLLARDLVATTQQLHQQYVALSSSNGSA